MKTFDAIIVGGGHAGIEALRVLCKKGHRVALVTLNKNKNGAMSCNPAIGGVAKGHMVHELDVLGGLMSEAADFATIQSRRLNMKKGPAVRSTRVQCDKDLYVSFMNSKLAQLEGLSVIEAEASELIVKNNKITGLRLADDVELECRALIITAGTFMSAVMHCGQKKTIGGRIGDKASNFLSKSLQAYGHSLSRLKTGTPPRLSSKSINFNNLEKQWSDESPKFFSWKNTSFQQKQLCCYITYTGAETEEIVKKYMDESPLFSGEIKGTGPRYCPSIEDKYKRFPDKKRHQIFLEPEGLTSDSVYPNGLSTSLSLETQMKFVRSIPGLECIEILRPGYAVEYDSLNPQEMTEQLMSKSVKGLFFAGQINRTSGYEEAAVQGLWAGLNASQMLDNKDFIFPDRSRSYMDTLVDDLVKKGTLEPYRMFTSRSEYRLTLREDNSPNRLFELASEHSLLEDKQISYYKDYFENIDKINSFSSAKRIRVNKDKVHSLSEHLKRPEVSLIDYCKEESSFSFSSPSFLRAMEKVEIDLKYSGYLSRQNDEQKKLKSLSLLELDPDTDLSLVQGIKEELREKFRKHRPKSVKELLSISGMSPTAVLIISKVASKKVSRETRVLS